MSQRWNNNDKSWEKIVPNRWQVFNNIPDYTEKILQSVFADDHNSWYNPVSTTGPYHDVFEKGYMKFPLENYNGRDFKSMALLAKNFIDYKWKNQFLIVKEFVNAIRPIINQYGPLGKISIWKLPPNQYIKEHNDFLDYHYSVSRWIYNLSHDSSDTDVTMNGNKILSNKNTIFPFFTPTDYHYFKNKSSKDWYFMAIDFWNINKLDDQFPKNKIEIDQWLNDSSRRLLIDNT